MKIAAVVEILSVGYVTAPSKTISKLCLQMDVKAPHHD